MTPLRHTALASAGALALAATAHAAVMYGPTTYHQTSDSPFYGAFQRGELYLEDFTVGEPFENRFQTPYVTSQSGYLGSGSGYFSVDGDDGVLDDFGRFGGSYVLTRGDVAPDGSGAWGRFDFLPGPNGHRPLAVGIVVTEIITYAEPVRLRAYDGAGNLVGDSGLMNFPRSLDLPHWPSPWYAGSAQFVGFVSDVPIATLTIDGAYAIDHLQYSFTRIPEPASAALLGAGAIISLRRRRTLKTA